MLLLHLHVLRFRLRHLNAHKTNNAGSLSRGMSKGGLDHGRGFAHQARSFVDQAAVDLH
jgi:hypothetical protein